jgi:hypothetical protein
MKQILASILVFLMLAGVAAAQMNPYPLYGTTAPLQPVKATSDQGTVTATSDASGYYQLELNSEWSYANLQVGNCFTTVALPQGPGRSFDFPCADVYVQPQQYVCSDGSRVTDASQCPVSHTVNVNNTVIVTNTVYVCSNGSKVSDPLACPIKTSVINTANLKLAASGAGALAVIAAAILAYQGWTVTKLKARAKALKIRGYSSMNKAQLIQAIVKAEQKK